jgi:putative ABC transport system ATP-binding protein
MDEPTSALDESSKLGVESLIREVMGNSKLTCVIVTHDTAQAARLADRAMILDSGRLVRLGSVNEILHA